MDVEDAGVADEGAAAGAEALQTEAHAEMDKL